MSTQLNDCSHRISWLSHCGSGRRNCPAYKYLTVTHLVWCRSKPARKAITHMPVLHSTKLQSIWLDHQTVRLGENVPLHTTIWREHLTWCGTLSTLNTATHRHYVISQNLKGFSGNKLSEDQTGKSFLGEKWLDNWLCWNKSDSTFQEGHLSFRLRKWLVMVLGGLSVRRVC